MITSAQEFYRLRTSEIPDEYQRAACEDAPLIVWQDIISTMPGMREWVATNKTVPIEILEVLAGDVDGRVRSAVAMKRKLPEVLQVVLARDADETVRNRLACNKKATKVVLEILADDSEAFVRERALDRLKIGDYVA